MLKWTNDTVMDKTPRGSSPSEIPDKPVVMEATFLKKINDRDINNEKLVSRYMVSQTNSNPFMANNDYLKDLEVQDSFLTPQNTGVMHK
tara:strand:+ start:204 stop:470 length:267 start_codon:yes stop_codon:yes gene_type:complete